MAPFNYGDDYIGTESCNIDLNDDIVLSETNTVVVSKNSAKRKEKRELPPPIPMEFVMRRYCTADGRLILKEEKLKHHECFTTHRANGRLTIHLVPLYQEEEEREEEDDEEQEEEEAPTPFAIRLRAEQVEDQCRSITVQG
ncbi:hypothetical protein DEO72_LG11g2864 [Vigna unguiculata]|uniref:FAF domain-containing protein n=2 Tax=Vigna unguiculata TaxID=3917 RepID=A0A4D6NSA4_VIGUN|nr:hypothetical protein DEO72_LG11g2864 [Vigna unguiculata]